MEWLKAYAQYYHIITFPLVLSHVLVADTSTRPFYVYPI